MKHCDTLIAPRWCVPVQPAGEALEKHAVAIADGRIIDLLPLAEAQQEYQPSITLTRPEHLLIPGFVNTHTHAAMTLMRGLCDDLPLQEWLTLGIWPAEKRWVSAEMVRDGTQLAIVEMLLGGTTCFSDQYFFPEVIAETANQMHIRANVGSPIIEFPTAWAGSIDEYFRKATDLLHDPYAGHPLISTCFAPHSTAALSDTAFTDLRVLADQLDKPVQIHLHETMAEIEASLGATGKRPLQRLADLGLVNSALLAVHAVHLQADEIRLLAETGVGIAHCPKSNLKLASGIAPIALYRDHGVRVGIGTDGAASNNTLDMLDEMQVAALLGKARADSAAAVSAREALRMATLDAAAVIGLADQIGSIECGKWADLCCVDLSSPHSQPVYDPISQLVYTARTSQVSDVWVAGRHHVDGGALTHIDVDAILARSERWRERIAANPS
jgi:5-methylthioadenosine/S-adenosylhomocysteine deaminase